MSHARFKRKKHGQLPGDLPKKTKIAMREFRFGRKLPRGISPEHAIAFQKFVKSRSQRAILKERDL